jgi:site-specific DNA-methyltransferase (adenine-specific)
LILYATKGQRGLITSPVDILDFSRVSRSERVHAAEKPVELLEALIGCSTLPGDFVLDPCCGSGSSLVAANNLKRTGMGIEIDDTFYNTAMSNVYKTITTTPELKDSPLDALA